MIKQISSIFQFEVYVGETCFNEFEKRKQWNLADASEDKRRREKNYIITVAYHVQNRKERRLSPIAAQSVYPPL